MNLWTEPGPFTVAELAAAARVSRSFVRKAITSGVLEGRRAGRLLRIPRDAARRFAEDVGATPPAAFVAHDAHDAHDGE